MTNSNAGFGKKLAMHGIQAILTPGAPDDQRLEQVNFKSIIYRPTGQVSGEVIKVVKVLNGEMKRAEIQNILQLKHDDFFRLNYILPALQLGYIEMKYPDKLNHPKQKYHLTTKGKKLQLQLQK